MPSPEAALSEVTRVLDLAGVAANAWLGGAVARRRRFDVVGLVALAIISGLGGGILRDVLLQRGPPVALTDLAYLVVAFAGAAVVLVTRPKSSKVWEGAFQIIDAAALGCWATAGAEKTLGAGLGWLPAVLLGTITAVGGGATRDIVLRRPPVIFRPGPLQASSAALGSIVLVVAHALGHPTAGLVLGIVTTTGSRLVAVKLGIRAPRIPYTKPRAPPDA